MAHFLKEAQVDWRLNLKTTAARSSKDHTLIKCQLILQTKSVVEYRHNLSTIFVSIFSPTDIVDKTLFSFLIQSVL